ncbi:MAG: ComF family protein [Cryobacterium sp.]|nr:ComF family protein [Cryobacterium sp.]
MSVSCVPLREALREALLDALAVVLPIDCAGCGAPDRALCSGCRAALAPQGLHRWIDETPAFAALSYEGSARRAILALKEEGRTDVARALARPLAETLTRVVCALADSRPGLAAPQLVTVAPSLAARRQRGYDPTALLLAGAGLRAAEVLAHARRSAPQKSLTETERAANRRGSLGLRRDVAGRSFIFVDDVVTTGATAREAVRAIAQAGGEVIAVVALAATPRLDRNEAARWETSW